MPRGRCEGILAWSKIGHNAAGFARRNYPSTMITVILLVLILIAAWAVFTFNRLVHLRNQVRTAWADIDVQLKRRHDLVPQLVNAVKGYAGFERGVLTAVTELRSQAMALTSPAKLGETETELQKGVAQILA